MCVCLLNVEGLAKGESVCVCVCVCVCARVCVCVRVCVSVCLSACLYKHDRTIAWQRYRLL